MRRFLAVFAVLAGFIVPTFAQTAGQSVPQQISVCQQLLNEANARIILLDANSAKQIADLQNRVADLQKQVDAKQKDVPQEK